MGLHIWELLRCDLACPVPFMVDNTGGWVLQPLSEVPLLVSRGAEAKSRAPESHTGLDFVQFTPCLEQNVKSVCCV